MQSPSNLEKGQTIGILSTARKISDSELKPLIKLIESWGLEYILGKTINAQENQFAGSVQLRATDFQEMLDNPKIRAIWCAKGGYGTVQIIDALDFTTFLKKPKWIIGYSDVTVLHAHIHNLGVETLHANMALEINTKTPETRETIKQALFQADYDITYQSSHTYNKSGIAKAQLVGGNLSILYSLCGSASAIKTDGKILFLEDLDEYLYHLDRMMQNLKRNGLLENLKGLIIGGMNKMNDNAVAYGKTANQIIFETVKEYNYPVCFNFPAGHLPDNRALVMGREIDLLIDERKVIINF